MNAEPQSLAIPKHTRLDLTPWERRRVVRCAAEALVTERWRLERAKKPVEPLSPEAAELARYGVHRLGPAWWCGGYRLPWPMETRDGLRRLAA